MSEPEKGDEVSWNWGNGAPGGTVAEKKTEGEVAITSKRGNKIKKNATSDDPAVAIERSGNNVVKKVSELNVEKKGASGGGGGKTNGEKRKKDDDVEEEGDEPTVENDQGEEVRPGGKKQKKTEEKTNGDKTKKAVGRPKGAAGGGKKEKKLTKPREVGTVSARTRSQNK